MLPLLVVRHFFLPYTGLWHLSEKRFTISSFSAMRSFEDCLTAQSAMIHKDNNCSLALPRIFHFELLGQSSVKSLVYRWLFYVAGSSSATAFIYFIFLIYFLNWKSRIVFYADFMMVRLPGPAAPKDNQTMTLPALCFTIGWFPVLLYLVYVMHGRSSGLICLEYCS